VRLYAKVVSTILLVVFRLACSYFARTLVIGQELDAPIFPQLQPVQQFNARLLKAPQHRGQARFQAASYKPEHSAFASAPRQASRPGSVHKLAPALRQHLQQAYLRSPLSFEANTGQVAQPVRFLSRGSGYNLFLTPTEAVLTLQKPATQPRKSHPQGNRSVPMTKQAAPTVLRMQLLNANHSPQVTGEHELPGKSNYFIGNNPTQWHTNISQYGRVKYQQVYPGVDLVYYGNQR